MAECKAWGCTNNKRKNPEKHYFCVPKPTTEEKKLRVQQWLHNLGNGHSIDTFKFGRNSVVCSDHFEERFIKRDLKAELLGLRVTYRLTDDAVPTIVKQPDTTDSHGRRTQRQIRKKRGIKNDVRTVSKNGCVNKMTNFSHCPVLTEVQTRKHEVDHKHVVLKETPNEVGNVYSDIFEKIQDKTQQYKDAAQRVEGHVGAFSANIYKNSIANFNECPLLMEIKIEPLDVKNNGHIHETSHNTVQNGEDETEEQIVEKDLGTTPTNVFDNDVSNCDECPLLMEVKAEPPDAESDHLPAEKLNEMYDHSNHTDLDMSMNAQFAHEHGVQTSEDSVRTVSRNQSDECPLLMEIKSEPPDIEENYV